MFRFVGTCLLALLTRHIFAQVASCTDIGCNIPPGSSYIDCTLDSVSFLSIGVTNFTTTLSSSPYTWTVGHHFIEPSEEGQSPLNSYDYFLGQPPDSDLRNNTSVKACALFFTGIAPKLNFGHSEAQANAVKPKGTCDDALSSPCVSDWTQQANDIARYSNEGNFTCDQIAAELQAHPPASCKVTKKSWGSVTAQAISGPAMSLPVPTDQCNNTMYSTYSETQIFNSNSSLSKQQYPVVPILTVMRRTNTAESSVSEAHLSCLKPVVDDIAAAETGFEGIATRYKAIQVMFQLFSVLLVLNWLM